MSLEELGYRKLTDNEDELRYSLDRETFKQSIVFRKKLEDFYVFSEDWWANDYKTWTTMSENNEFRDEFDKYCARYGHWQVNTFNFINIKLLQAINKQCEELGWI